MDKIDQVIFDEILTEARSKYPRAVSDYEALDLLASSYYRDLQQAPRSKMHPGARTSMRERYRLIMDAKDYVFLREMHSLSNPNLIGSLVQ